MQDDRKRTVDDTLPTFLGVVDEKQLKRNSGWARRGLLKRAEREQKN